MKTEEKCDHEHSPSQKPGMSNKEFITRITELMNELAEFNVLFRGEETNENGEHGFTPSDAFRSRLEEHYRIQAEIEYMDSKNGNDSTKEYGGVSRDKYIIGICINEFLNFIPKDCEKCKEIVIKYRLEDGFGPVMDEHVKNEHPEGHKKIQESKGKMNEWITLVNELVNKTKEREWRSTI